MLVAAGVVRYAPLGTRRPVGELHDTIKALRTALAVVADPDLIPALDIRSLSDLELPEHLTPCPTCSAKVSALVRHDAPMTRVGAEMLAPLNSPVFRALPCGHAADVEVRLASVPIPETEDRYAYWLVGQTSQGG